MKNIKNNNYSFLTELSKICEQLLKTKDRIIVCVTGKSGVGKSTFGKYVRKNGFGKFSKYKISVIDDSVMSLDLFYLFNKRVRAKSKVRDELKPFFERLPNRKKIVFYVNTTPERRLSCSDLIINLVLKDEDERIVRLKKRGESICEAHFIDSANARKNISHEYFFEFQV
ncbi:MAG: hypothetical protein D6B27_11130 [Gammaproteobacteria bacterium]|nr:MAG: hypothetical protein D6B27_11130 [Gammaproteobacteria bacterium]